MTRIGIPIGAKLLDIGAAGAAGIGRAVGSNRGRVAIAGSAAAGAMALGSQAMAYGREDPTILPDGEYLRWKPTTENRIPVLPESRGTDGIKPLAELPAFREVHMPDGWARQREVDAPWVIVVHATGNEEVGTARNETAEGIREHWKSHFEATTHHVAAHYYIADNGEIAQWVPDEFRSGHVGQNGWNDISIGIELQNDNSGLDPYTPEQIESLRLLTRALATKYSIPVNNIVTHRAIQPDNRKDPVGFPWYDFLKSLDDDEPYSGEYLHADGDDNPPDEKEAIGDGVPFSEVDGGLPPAEGSSGTGEPPTDTTVPSTTDTTVSATTETTVPSTTDTTVSSTTETTAPSTTDTTVSSTTETTTPPTTDPTAPPTTQTTAPPTTSPPPSADPPTEPPPAPADPGESKGLLDGIIKGVGSFFGKDEYPPDPPASEPPASEPPASGPPTSEAPASEPPTSEAPPAEPSSEPSAEQLPQSPAPKSGDGVPESPLPQPPTDGRAAETPVPEPPDAREAGESPPPTPPDTAADAQPVSPKPPAPPITERLAGLFGFVSADRDQPAADQAVESAQTVEDATTVTGGGPGSANAPVAATADAERGSGLLGWVSSLLFGS